MSGRQRNGAFAGTLTSLVLQDRERRMKQEDSRTEFDRRLQAAGIVAGIKSGAISPQFNPQGQLQGFQKNQAAQQDPLSIDELVKGGAEVTQHIKGPNGTTITIRHKSPKADKPLSPQNQLYQDTRNAADNLQRNQAMPAETFIPEARQQLINNLPETPFVNGPDGGFITGQDVEGQTVPRSQVVSAMAPQVAQQMAPTIKQPMIDQAQGNLDNLMQTRQMLSPTRVAKTSDTVSFRQDIQDAVTAVSNRKISKKDAINRLMRAYPDKAKKIDELSQQLF